MKRLVSLALLLAVTAALPAGASTFLAMSRADLVKASAAVVQGEVVQVNSFWSESGRIIVTEALVRVEEVIHGQSPSVVIVRTVGGEVAEFGVEAHGFPKFSAGERLVLFLEPENEGVARVAGYQQGQFRIERDAKGVERAVSAIEGDIQFATPDGRPVPRMEPTELATFKSQIRDVAERAERIRQN